MAHIVSDAAWWAGRARPRPGFKVDVRFVSVAMADRPTVKHHAARSAAWNLKTATMRSDQRPIVIMLNHDLSGKPAICKVTGVGTGAVTFGEH